MMNALAITGWGVISPIGIGRPQFTEALHDTRPAWSPVADVVSGSLPMDHAGVIPEFRTAAFLGSKGTRSMDRTTAMAVSAVGMALDHSGVGPDVPRARIGLALGTSTGSIRSISEFTRETLTHERPYLVNPALFPNTVMNCAAGQSAIWHGLKGPNATISGGHLSGLLALRYAGLTLHRGYADVLVTGCVEEFCAETAWAWHHTSAGGRPLGEGCAMFVVEPAERVAEQRRPPLAHVLGCEVGTYAAEGADGARTHAAGLASCIHRVLERAGVGADEVDVVSTSRRGVPVLDGVERHGVCEALGRRAARHHLAVADRVGDTLSALGGFQLAAVLALFASTQPHARHALITCIGQHGTTGCVLLRNGAR
jgi:3-oxoacyl-[acyl-carrier-protein] synthase II